MKAKLLFLSLIVVSSIIIIFKLNTKPEENIIKIGMMSGWAPFMSINAQGTFEGFDVDVANELAQRLGKKSQIVDMGSLAALFVALETNKIDMIFSGLDITEERLKKLTMTPYAGEKVDEYYLLFWNKIPEDIQSLADFKKYPNATVVVEPGVSAEKLINNYDFIKKKQIASLADRMLDVQYNKSLAMLLEPTLARALMRKNPNFKALPVPLPTELQIYGMGIASKKDKLPLAEDIKKAVDAMKKDGSLQKLEAKWQLSEVVDEV